MYRHTEIMTENIKNIRKYFCNIEQLNRIKKNINLDSWLHEYQQNSFILLSYTYCIR